MNWSDLTAGVEFQAYRVGTYLLLSFIDDPVWLALMFC